MTSGTVATAVEVQLPLKVVRRKIERVGFAYFAQRRQFLAPGGVERSESDEKLEGVGEEVDISYLKSLDPKEWKDQDHYAVLGLGKLRLVRRQHVVFFPCVRFYQYLMGLPQLILYLNHPLDTRPARMMFDGLTGAWFCCTIPISGKPRARKSSRTMITSHA